ncbi:helix-turn-helix domain-containing protein [Haloarcula nitratireducens]|uniref:Helix-turn-helix domain-containing protein n=1 Tax=Haloarcula nitratireducens TaxID=2487749 RepID=A0AAW4PGV8_9EURY|nr:helix-turn-helix domain-containing protein [Halomicroarcula nitratireducens]MBX0296823.1 helix-turn-helix domain-containing protein [Halomicroarcula nitratireducens]
MTTVVRASIPVQELALSQTFASLPDLAVKAERVVQSGRDVVMPLMWVRNTEPEQFGAACEQDPTVENVELLAEFEDEFLYRMEWTDQIELLLQMLTNSEASILAIYGEGECWHLRLLCPSRDHLSEIKTFCSEHELQFAIDAIHEMDGEPASRYGLTTTQYEALVTAVQMGHFQVPKEVDLDVVAEELGISHQALSECLRRGTQTLIEDTLMVGLSETDEPSDKTAPQSDSGIGT